MESRCGNHSEVCAAYGVSASGLINSPGKFEGEPTFAVFYWDAVLSGFSDEEGCEDGRPVSRFYVDADDRAKFPDLADVAVVDIWESDMGFVYTDTYESAEKAPELGQDYPIHWHTTERN